MQSGVSKQNKKGLTLPVALVTGIFLVLIASSLLFIALNSMSRTSADINGRQAYLNAKSALEYAKAYYTGASNMSEMTEVEYMIMNDVGGTTSEGAEITKNEEDTAHATTYVMALYIPAEDGGPALQLRAISRYADPFGNRGQSAVVGMRYEVGSSKLNRYASFTVPNEPKASIEDRITLHVKQPKDMNYQLSYYIWTYKDTGHAYDEYYNNKLENTTNSIEWYPSDVAKLNATTVSANSVKPNGIWATGSNGRQGPPAIMATTGDDDLWTTGSYVIKKGRVPWFNVIFAQKGSILANGNYVNSQTNEMFHLWYIDPADKHIYFEFTGKRHDDGSITRYYGGKSWDGRQGLEYETDPNSTTQTTVLVYLKNQKTTVHFRIHGLDDGATQTSIPAGQRPVITSIMNEDGTAIDTSSKSYIYSTKTSTVNKRASNIQMEYEGCGWWVANVDTKKSFALTISVNGAAYSVSNVRSDSDGNAWVVLRNGTLSASLTESRTGADTDSYVTVHAKTADFTRMATPTLSYKIVGANSSAGRERLQRRIFEASQIKSFDYTPETYSVFAEKLNAAIAMYNDKEFVKNQPGSNIKEKMAAADTKYDDAISQLDAAEAALKTAGVTDEQLEPLRLVIATAEGIINAEETRGLYDYAAYQNFIRAGSPYQVAKSGYLDTSTLTSSLITDYVQALTESINDMNDNQKLNRVILGGLITDAEALLYNDHYTEESRNELRTVLDGKPSEAGARAVYAEKFISQDVIDAMCTRVEAQIRVVKASLSTPLETTELQALLEEVQGPNYLGMTEKVNCTDESYNKLQEAFNKAQEDFAKIEFQEDVVAIQTALEKARDQFTIVKPAASSDLILRDSKLRVWIDNNSSYPFDLAQYADETTEQPSVISSIDLHADEAGNCFYDVDLQHVKFVSLIVSKTVTSADGEITTEEIVSEKVDLTAIADGNLAFVVTPDAVIKKTTMTAVYFPQLTGEVSGKVGAKVIDATYEAPYYVFRYETDKNNKLTVKQVYLPPEGGLNKTVAFTMKTKLGAGDYIAQTDGTVTNPAALAVTNVYPKLVTEPETPPEPQGTVAHDDYNITNVAANFDNLDTSEFAEAIAAGKNVIVVDASQSSEFGSYTSLWIYAWKVGGGDVYGSWSANAQSMLKTNDGKYFYVYADSSVNIEGVIILRGQKASGNKITGDCRFPTPVAGKPIYLVQKSGTVTAKEYNASPATDPFAGQPEMEKVNEADMDAKDIPLAYVGGSKARITNRPYYEIYGSGRKTNDLRYAMNDSNYMYGGDGGTCDNDNRVGASQLSSYFDWYEVKIPVPQSVKYTFQLKGMNPSDSNRKTVQIKGVYNDVWLAQLDNTSTTDGEYSKIDLLSFELEDDNIPENLTVYFRLPTNWKTDIQLAGHGNATVVKNSPDGHLNSPNSNVYYFKNLSKKTPYLKFTVTDDEDHLRTYYACLKGGDYLLFDPLYDDGTGEGSWREFKSAQTKLKEVLRDIQADYYGHVVVNVYDENGEVFDMGDDTYYYSEFLRMTVSDNKFFHYSGSGTAADSAYQMNINAIEAMSEVEANGYAERLRTITDAYRELYQQMSEARKYIDAPLSVGKHNQQNNKTGGRGRYPEYLARKDYTKYSSSSIESLKNKLKTAEEDYLSISGLKVQSYNSTINSNYLNKIRAHTIALKSGIDYLGVENENAIGVLLFDAQNKVRKGSTFKIQYREEKTGDLVIKPVTNYNPIGYPIYFIVPTNTTKTVYDVQFVEETISGSSVLGPKKDVMRLEDHIDWVFYDSLTPYWVENTTTDYRELNSDIFSAPTVADQQTYDMKPEVKKVVRKDASGKVIRDVNGDPEYDMIQQTDNQGRVKYQEMTLLFDQNAFVTWEEGRETKSYTIAAGAYTFLDGYTSPIVNGKLNLFSDAARAYFAQRDLYGKYTTNAVDAVTDLHWHNGLQGGDDGVGVFKTGYNAQAGRNINFEASSGDFLTYGTSYTYYSSEGLSFRWSGNEPLYTSTPVVLQGKEIVLASTTGGVINGTKATTPYFLLKSSDLTAKSMDVTFVTDVYVTYEDRMGHKQKFVIMEGTYNIEKADPDSDYIANLYDYDYWHNNQYVHAKSRNKETVVGTGSSNLVHGTYTR